MQTTLRKTDSKPKTKEKSKDDLTSVSKKPQDDKLKKSVYSVTTPRNFIQKSSTADIYVQKKQVQQVKAPKKLPGSTITTNVSPMKDLLKSSASSVSQISTKKVSNSPKAKNEAKVPSSARHTTPRTAKDLPFVNVTVNSPIARKKLEKDGGKSSENKEKKQVVSKALERSSGAIERKVDSKQVERQRTKTRTLNDNEAKILTPDIVDNNAEMLNLSRKLAAKPKAFFVDLESEKPKAYQIEKKESEDEVDYEDDFESYESDFESYHESPSDNTDHDTEDLSTGDEENEANQSRNEDEVYSEKGAHGGQKENDEYNGVKEGKDEEKMLDSGNFDLRDARSANKAKTMQDILEDTELDVRSSLTDEGFQEMSSGSIRTVHTEVFERPLFIDFTKGKENKRKRKIFERLKQRAKDILSMVTLHEMSYSLFEMKPIPYDLYMATFGRSNYVQMAVQTFDDGVTEEVQTEDILAEEKWTQHPVKFSKHNIYLKPSSKTRKYSNSTEDYLSKFTFLINSKTDVETNNMINLDEDYKSNPLRVYFEQKDGVGSTEMLPYESYKNKLNNKEFNTGKLRKFLKKVESRISNILSVNTGTTDSTELVKTSKYPFSEGYISLTAKNIADDKYSFLKLLKITGVIFSDTKSNLIMTVHSRLPNVLEHKCVICLWDVNVVKRDPVKILIAIDNVSVGQFKGNTDGIFVAALEDGSLHLWDLSEEPTWRPDVANNEKSLDLVEIKGEGRTQTELDREWNLINSNVGCATTMPEYALQACAFTSSALNIQSDDAVDSIVGLELDTRSVAQDNGRKVLGQVCSLQRIGILTIWSLIQERLKSSDMGKAYWSKIKLEITQTVMLMDHLDLPRANSPESTFVPSFNLNAAKRRTSVRRKEKKQITRQKSAVKSDRPASAASFKNIILPQNNWETGIVCSDLKIMRMENRDYYLVAKNCGEVLCCTKTTGVFKINKFCVAVDASSVTSLDVSTHSLPYFLAATDSGTVNLCSILESRVLLTLDCRNGPPSSESERYQVDSKGRYLGSATVKPENSLLSIRPSAGISVKTVIWSRVNPFCMYALLRSGALLAWDLTKSDIRAEHIVEGAASGMAGCDGALALITSACGEVQVLRLRGTRRAQEHLQLFTAYATLL